MNPNAGKKLSKIKGGPSISQDVSINNDQQPESSIVIELIGAGDDLSDSFTEVEHFSAFSFQINQET